MIPATAVGFFLSKASTYSWIDHIYDYSLPVGWLYEGLLTIDFFGKYRSWLIDLTRSLSYHYVFEDALIIGSLIGIFSSIMYAILPEKQMQKQQLTKSLYKSMLIYAIVIIIIAAILISHLYAMYHSAPLSKKLIGTINWKTMESYYVSPNLSRFAWISKEGNLFYLIADGKKSALCTGIQDVIFSADSKHLAYIATKNNEWFVIIDGVKSIAYEAIANITSADQRHRERTRWQRQLIDAKDKYFIFSPDGNHLAYVKRHSEKMSVVVDENEQAPYDEIDSFPIFSYNSKHIGYVVGTAKSTDMKMVIDGKESKWFEHIFSSVRTYHDFRSIAEFDLIEFSPDGLHVASRVHLPTKWDTFMDRSGRTSKRCVLMVDNVKLGAYGNVGTIVFSPDSKNVAYVAIADTLLGMRWYVISGDKIHKSYDRIDKLFFDANNFINYIAFDDNRIYAIKEKK